MADEQPQVITLRQYMHELARKYEVDPGLAEVILQKESSGGVHQRTDGSLVEGTPTKYGTAVGMFQVLPSTAAAWGLDPKDPMQNVEAGIRMIKEASDRDPDPYQIFSYYHGGPNRAIWGKNTKAYADDATQRFLKYLDARERGGISPPEEPLPPPGLNARNQPGLPTDRPPTLWERFTGHAEQLPPDIQARIDYGNAIAKLPPGAPLPPPPPQPALFRDPHALGLDPRHPEDWKNIGGTVGGIGGGIAGTYAAPGPGTVYGSVGGAATGGAIGEGLRQYFYPPGPNDPDAGHSPASSIIHAGAEQGLYDLAGQAVALPFRIVGKRVIQGKVSENAARFFEDARRALVDEHSRLVDTMSATRRADQFARREAEIALKESGEQSVAAAGRTGQAGIAAAQIALDRAEQEVTKAREAAKQTMRTTARAGAGETRTVRKAGQAEVDRQLAEAERTLAQLRAEYTTRFGGPPAGQIPAGQAVVDVVKGPIQRFRDTVGQLVRKSAEDGPDVAFPRGDPLRAELDRIVDTELLPQEIVFPDQPVQPTGRPGRPTHPGRSNRIADTMAQISTAQKAELVKHPAMDIIRRLYFAPEKIRFRDLAALSSELQAARRAGGDPFTKNKVEGLTTHLAALVRDKLASANHLPYEEATKKYSWLMDFLEEGHGPDIAKAIERNKPEAVAQMFSPDDPSFAKRFVEMMTDVAGEAGASAEGKAALGKVQRAWMDRELFGKGAEGLPEALAALDTTHAEFRDAFLNTPETREVLDTARKVARGWLDTLLANEQKVAAARATKTTGVETAQTRARTAFESAQGTTEAQVKAAKDAAEKAGLGVASAKATSEKGVLDAKRAARRALRDAQKAGRKERFLSGEELAAARAKLKAARQPTAEEIAFLRSSVSPEALRETRNNLLIALKAAIGSAALGPKGAAAMTLLQRRFATATDADLLKYAFALPKAKQQIFVDLVTSSLPGAALAQAGREASRRTGVSSTDVAKGLVDAAFGKDKDKPAATPPPAR